MNTLFLRIFIAFWLTTLIALVAGQQVSQLLQKEGPRVDKIREQHEAARQFLHRAARRYRRDTPEEWQHWLEQKHNEFDWMLYRPTGEDLSRGLVWTPEFEALISDRPLRSFRRPIPLKNGALIVQPLINRHGVDGYLLAQVRHPHPLLVEWFHRHLWLRLLLALLATGAISYWMVRRYTQPIRQLREATRQLANGDLSVRLSDKPGSDDLTALRRDFNNMASRLEEARLRQNRLLHDVSHELRTPLARIQAALALAERRHGDGEELKHIQRECDALNSLIEQLLREPDQQETLNDTVVLQDFLQKLLHQNQLEADSRHQTLKLENTIREEVWVQVAASALHSAIENVLRNAMRYSPDHSTITLSLTHSTPEEFVIEIRDQGPGVPKDSLDRLFEPFFRLDSSRSRDSGGFGLGLAICRRIIESHGGRVSAGNLSPGLAVRLTLPASLQVAPTTD